MLSSEWELDVGLCPKQQEQQTCAARTLMSEDFSNSAQPIIPLSSLTINIKIRLICITCHNMYSNITDKELKEMVDYIKGYTFTTNESLLLDVILINKTKML